MEFSGFRKDYCNVTVPSDKPSLPPPLIKSAESQPKLMSCTGVWKNLQPFKELAALLGILKTPTASFLCHILRAYSTDFGVSRLCAPYGGHFIILEFLMTVTWSQMF